MPIVQYAIMRSTSKVAPWVILSACTHKARLGLVVQHQQHQHNLQLFMSRRRLEPSGSSHCTCGQDIRHTGLLLVYGRVRGQPRVCRRGCSQWQLPPCCSEGSVHAVWFSSSQLFTHVHY